MGACLKKALAQAGGAIAVSQYNTGGRNRPPAPPPRSTRFLKIPRASVRGRGSSPSANALPTRGTELFRFLIFTVRQAGTVKLDPCLADAPCHRPGPAISK